MYGVETWTWIKADISRLTAAEIKFIRSIEGKTERGKIRSKKELVLELP
jgi:hypothetical protein